MERDKDILKEVADNILIHSDPMSFAEEELQTEIEEKLHQIEDDVAK
jgi:hypothetical protein